MGHVYPQIGLHHDAKHLWARFRAKMRSAIHHRVLRLQFRPMKQNDAQDAPFAILRNGLRVDIVRRSRRRSRGWITATGEEITSAVIVRFMNMHECGY